MELSMSEITTRIMVLNRLIKSERADLVAYAKCRTPYLAVKQARIKLAALEKEVGLLRARLSNPITEESKGANPMKDVIYANKLKALDKMILQQTRYVRDLRDSGATDAERTAALLVLSDTNNRRYILKKEYVAACYEGSFANYGTDKLADHFSSATDQAGEFKDDVIPVEDLEYNMTEVAEHLRLYTGNLETQLAAHKVLTAKAKAKHAALKTAMGKLFGRFVGARVDELVALLDKEDVEAELESYKELETETDALEQTNKALLKTVIKFDARSREQMDNIAELEDANDDLETENVHLGAENRALLAATTHLNKILSERSGIMFSLVTRNRDLTTELADSHNAESTTLSKMEELAGNLFNAQVEQNRLTEDSNSLKAERRELRKAVADKGLEAALIIQGVEQIIEYRAKGLEAATIILGLEQVIDYRK